MKLHRFLLAAGLALAILSTPAWAITFPAFADTAGAPAPGALSKSAGKATTLAVSAKSTAFVSFNVSGSGLVTDPIAVTAARLIIYFPKITKPGNITVTANGTAFSETVPGSSPAPSGTLAGLAPAPFGVATALSKNFFIVDVTGIVSTWLLNPNLEQGFAIAGDATVSATIGAKEGSGSGYPVVLEVDASTTTGTLSGTNANFFGKLGVGTFTPQSAVQVGDFSTVGVDNFLSVVSNGVNTSNPPADRLSGINLQNFSTNFGFTIQSRDGVSSSGLEIVNNNGSVGGPPAIFIDRGTSNVGIGTTAPTKAKLVVNGFVQNSISVGQFFNASGITPLGGVATNFNVSIFASNGTWTGGAFITSSDARTKDIQSISDGAADLRTLSNIEITNYRYKDVIAKGSAPQKKVIAQQVEKVFPQAVSLHTDTVPDIYRAATIADGWTILATDLKVGDRVKLIAENDAETIGEVREVTPTAFRTDGKTADGKVFVYGREVKDFRAVDYDAIAMLNVSATQELARKLEAKDAEIAALKAANLALAAKMAAFDEKLTALKASLDDRPARTVRAALELK
ncbi:MAG: tail fiber domain-containing protein [Chthoniobacteraceae bacterium]